MMHLGFAEWALIGFAAVIVVGWLLSNVGPKG